MTFPTQTMLVVRNPRYSGRSDFKSAGNVPVFKSGHGQPFDMINLTGRKFRPRSTVYRSSINSVSGAGSPLQVLRPIVRSVSIFVIHVIVFFTRRRPVGEPTDQSCEFHSRPVQADTPVSLIINTNRDTRSCLKNNLFIPDAESNANGANYSPICCRCHGDIISCRCHVGNSTRSERG